jgi:hypothetical protein
MTLSPNTAGPRGSGLICPGRSEPIPVLPPTPDRTDEVQLVRHGASWPDIVLLTGTTPNGGA